MNVVGGQSFADQTGLSCSSILLPASA